MKTWILITLIVCLLLLAACAPGTERFKDKDKPAGFFWGIWHGWIAPVSVVWQLFNPSVRIYEGNNAGWAYDFGFYIAVVGGFGSAALSRKRRKCKNKD